MSEAAGSNSAWIGLGANLGDAGASFDSALESIAALAHTCLRRVSSRYRSAPVLADGPDYLNAVAEIGTRLTPRELLDALLAIELAHGRQRTYVNAPRTLDLDLLLHGSTEHNDERLTLPHPRMHLRAFVLAPLAELAPALEIPGRGRVDSLLAGCRDQACLRVTEPAARA